MAQISKYGCGQISHSNSKRVNKISFFIGIYVLRAFNERHVLLPNDNLMLAVAFINHRDRIEIQSEIHLDESNRPRCISIRSII